MFQVDVSVNLKSIGKIIVVNTGYKRKIDGYYLYRIKDKKLNNIEIWHDRKESWEVLTYKIFKAIYEHKFNIAA
jgi:hypothetical protein